MRMIALACALTIAACAEAPAPPDAPVTARIDAKLAGKDIHLVLHDCKVYRAESAAPKAKRTLVLEPELYPFFTVCSRESLTLESEYVLAMLGRQALGAGGCCASGGNYRSADGVTWEKRDGGKWKAVEK